MNLGILLGAYMYSKFGWSGAFAVWVIWTALDVAEAIWFPDFFASLL